MTNIIDRTRSLETRGVTFAVISAVMLGLTPIFGKQAILAGLHPLTTVAMRTVGATVLLLIVLAIFKPKFFYIYPVGLAGCVLAGALNGLGSVFFYAGLGRIGASLGQFLFTLYPIFVAGLLFLDGQRTSKLTLFRLAISVIGVLMLTQKNNGIVDIIGVLFMLGAALLYALHIPINQRVLYEVPAPTVTFYTLLSMVIVVVPVKLVATGLSFSIPDAASKPLLLLTLVTFVSRIALFAGVKAIGGVQTAIIGLLELLVTVFLAIIYLDETLSLRQWMGASFLVATLILAAFEPQLSSVRPSRGWLYWLRPPVPPQTPQTSMNEHDSDHEDVAIEA